MKELLKQFVLVSALSLLLLGKASGQCIGTQTSFTVIVDGFASSFPDQMSWSLVNVSNGQSVISYHCGDYLDNFDGVTTFDTVCLTNGGTYAFKAYDDYGDGWNGGTFEIRLTSNGGLVLSGAPGIGVNPGDSSSLCDGSVLEDSAVFVVGAPIHGCTNPNALNYNPAATVEDGSCQLPPSNDSCIHAIVVSCGSVITGSTIFADNQGQPDQSCGTEPQAPGVWFKFIGTGQNVTASLCGSTYDTRINIYDGTNGCDPINLQSGCVGGNDDAQSCGAGSVQSEITFFSSVGVPYYILVNGYDGQTGTFTLTISCTGTCNPISLNDNCSTATLLNISPFGSCVAHHDNNNCAYNAIINPFCDLYGSIKDVWYTFNTGLNSAVYLNLDSISSNLPKYALYDACGGNIVICNTNPVAGRNVIDNLSLNKNYWLQLWTNTVSSGEFTLCLEKLDCPQPGSPVVTNITPNSVTLSWSSISAADSFRYEIGDSGFVAGSNSLTGIYGINGPPLLLAGLTPHKTYSIYLRNLCGLSDSSSLTGPITFTTLYAPPPNDSCINAITLGCNSVTYASTYGATEVGQPSTVCGTHPDAPGIWYSIVGTGSNVTISSCNSSYDTKINVYDGTNGCSTAALENNCVGGNDDSQECGEGSSGSSITFPGANGTPYYILVSGWHGAVGHFQLNLSCPAACTVLPSNDVCSTATLLPVSSSSSCSFIIDSNICAFAATANPSCDPTGSVKDVWYKFNTGLNNHLVLNYDTISADAIAVALFDTCSGTELFCSGLSSGGSQTLSNLQINHTYYLQVWTSANKPGTYKLCLGVITCQTLTSTQNVAICQGQSYLFNGINRTSSGTYLDTLVASNGCDSILTLNLTVKPIHTGSITASICQGQSYLFNGVNRTSTGTYLDTLVASNGCDSILTLNLTVKPIHTGSITANICPGQSYFFNGVNRTSTGTYLDTLVASNGCDSILTLNLTVKPTSTGTLNVGLCQGQSYFFNGIIHTSGGTFLDTLVNAGGCDSILTLNLTVNSSVASNVSAGICPGQSYFFNGVNRTSAGTYLDTLTAIGGCDSIVTLHLLVNPITTGSITTSICQGLSYLFNGVYRTNTGTYLDTLVSSNGCDSILTLHLTVNPIVTFVNQSICNGSSYSFNGQQLTQTGVYLDTLTGSLGCDSIITLNLNVIPGGTVVPLISINSNQNNICTGGSVTFTATPTNEGSNPSYQWKVDGNNVGGNSSTFTTTTLTNGQVVSCVLTSSLSCANPLTATSNTITMSVNSTLTPEVSISGTDTICNGGSATFTATAINGGSNPSYQWKVDGNNLGSNSSTFTSTTLANGQVVSCVLTSNLACANPLTATSNSIPISVNSNSAVAPTISISGNNTICAGATTSFVAQITNGGSSPNYQWKVNGLNIGINSYLYTAFGLQNGDTVTCLLTSNATCANPTIISSNSIIIKIESPLPPLSANIAVSDSTPCAGQPVTFHATLTGQGSTPTILWLINNQYVSGASDTLFTTSSLSGTSNIFLNVTSSPSCFNQQSANSNLIHVVVYPNPPTPNVTQYGDTLISSESSGNQWYLNGVILNGATDQIYYPQQPGNYQVMITDVNGCISAKSNAIWYLTGIEKLGSSSVIVFPNPAEEALFFRAINSKITLVEIINILGQTITTFDVNSSFYQFNISGMISGNYFCRIYTTDGVAHKIITVAKNKGF